MKKILILTLSLTLLVSLCACGNKVKGTEQELKAMKKAEFYAELPTSPPSAIYKDLLEDGYTREEAKFALENADIDWDKRAIACADMYFNNLIKRMNEDEVRETMLMVGFTEEQTEYGIAAYLEKNE